MESWNDSAIDSGSPQWLNGHMKDIEYIAEHIATGETVEWGDIIISNNGNRYTFINAVSPNRIHVWDGRNKAYRTLYAASVFGIRTRTIKGA